MRPVMCTISKQTVQGGRLLVEATCPAGHTLTKGQNGYLVDGKSGAIVQNGHVTITVLTGNAVKAEAPKLAKPVPGAKLRFEVYY
jgi:hypothetical protein